MLLILTQEKDMTTDDVIDWLRYYKVPFIRVNETSTFDINNLKISNDSIDANIEINYKNLNKNRVKLSEISAFWYRRGGIGFSRIALPEGIKGSRFSNLFKEKLGGYLFRERQSITNLLYLYFITLPSIGNFFDNATNKVLNLQVAKSVGLSVPETLITNKVKELKKFHQEHGDLITKAIDFGYVDIGTQNGKNISIAGYTHLIENYDLQDRKTLSLVQEKLDKKMELRIFFLHGRCFTSAIFSQSDKQTMIDFRHYNRTHPNRTPPYILPKEIEDKINKLMEALNMDSGSLDVVVTKSGDYVFLEVNPVGQFNQVSVPCNYYLEREIAKYFKSCVVQPKGKHELLTTV